MSQGVLVDDRMVGHEDLAGGMAKRRTRSDSVGHLAVVPGGS